MRWIVFIAALLFITGCAPVTSPAPQSPCLSASQLSGYSYDQLSRVATQMRDDGKKIEDFSLLITAMKGSVNNYSTVLQSSAYLSNAIRFLPIPYAGEVSGVTKVLSNTLIHLGSAAAALDKYKKSSSAFLESFDKLDRATATPAQLAKLATYADTTVLNDAAELQTAMQKISSSASLLSATAQTISNAMETTGGYVNQAKSFVGLQPAANDKAKVIESRDTLNSRLAQLSQKISTLEHSGDSNRQNIAKARTYADLAVQLERR